LLDEPSSRRSDPLRARVTAFSNLRAGFATQTAQTRDIPRFASGTPLAPLGSKINSNAEKQL
jgi:hypothetical protein